MTPALMTDERHALIDAVRTFADREWGTAEQLERLTHNHEHSHNADLCRKLGELGYIGIGLPEDVGGGGGTIVDSCLLMEELFYAKAPLTGLYTSMTVAETVERHAEGALREELLTSIIAGDTHVLGFSEPGAGSDLASLRCKAVSNGSGWVVNGQKTWTTNAHLGDHILLMVRTGGPESRHTGITMLSVPMDTPGIEVSGIDSLGGREVNDVFFTDVHVPADRLIGAQNQGWPQLMAGLNAERLLIGAIFLGHGRRAFDDALQYVKEREQFGQPIGTFQAIRHRFADLAAELECCRLLVYDVARKTEPTRTRSCRARPRSSSSKSPRRRAGLPWSACR